MKRSSVLFASPGRVEIVAEELGPLPEGAVLVETIVSAISAGTESLFYHGRVPEGLPVDAAIHGMHEPAAYPLKYGYAAVGRVVETGSGVDGDWSGVNVFVLHPHEDRFFAAAEELVRLPEDLEPEDAVFFATMETAVTLTLDAAPAIGEDAVVFGQGALGLLTTALLAAHPLDRIFTVDPVGARRQRSVAMGAAGSFAPDEAPRRLREALGAAGADFAIEVSGNPEALNDAVASVGFGGRVIVGSWYGTKRTTLDLGSAFHRDRVRIESSQVSTIDPARGGRWDRHRRRRVALSMLRRIHPSSLVTDRIPLERASEAYERIDRDPEGVLQVLLTYDGRM